MITDRSTGIKRLIGISGLMFMAIMIGLYLYFLHTGQAQQAIRHIRYMGFTGAIIGIAVQAIVNIVPVPGEFISILLMELYGPVWGGVCSWLGGLLGALGAFLMTRWVIRPIAENWTKPILRKVDAFIEKRGAVGLLIIRFIPFVPYHPVNYAAGLLRVKVWTFVWTTGLGILPYTIAVSGVYAGVRNGSWIWGVFGVVLFGLLLLLGRFLRKSGKAR